MSYLLLGYGNVQVVPFLYILGIMAVPSMIGQFIVLVLMLGIKISAPKITEIEAEII